MLKSTLLTAATLVLLLESAALAQTARVYTISGGKVTVQRENRTDWLPVRAGTELYEGDQIFPDRKVKAYIRCPDQSQPVLARRLSREPYAEAVAVNRHPSAPKVEL